MYIGYLLGEMISIPTDVASACNYLQAEGSEFQPLISKVLEVGIPHETDLVADSPKTDILWQKTLPDKQLWKTWCYDGRYVSSSFSMVPFNRTLPSGEQKVFYFAVVRFVDYRLYDTTGRYRFHEGSISEAFPQGRCATRNAAVVYDQDFEIVEYHPLLEKEAPFETRVQGLEDIRLIDTQNFIATSGSHLKDKITIVRGRIDRAQDGWRLNVCQIYEPLFYGTEKNWAPLPLQQGQAAKAIYSFEPLRVIDLFTATTMDSKLNLGVKDLRGSSNGLVYKKGDQLGVLFITHQCTTHPKLDRVYLHRMVWLRADMGQAYVSDAFSFFGYAVEFCLSLMQGDGHLLASVSTWDRTSSVVALPLPKWESMREVTVA